jgi:hypothetical protein
MDCFEFIVLHRNILPPFRGLSPEEISRIEIGAGGKIPRVAFKYLAAMGADSGELRPFGATQCGRYSELREFSSYLAALERGYISLAYETDAEEGSPFDSYIAIDGCDMSDPRLIMFERGGDFNDEEIVDSGYTLLDVISASTFSFLKISQLPHKMRCTMYLTAPDAVNGASDCVCNILTEAGYSSLMSEVPHKRFYCLGESSVLVDMATKYNVLDLSLAGLERDSVNSIINLLQDNLSQNIKYRVEPI